MPQNIYASEDNKKLIDAVHLQSCMVGGRLIRYRDAIGTMGNSAGDVGAAGLRQLGFSLASDGNIMVAPDSRAELLLMLETERQKLRAAEQQSILALNQHKAQLEYAANLAFVDAANRVQEATAAAQQASSEADRRVQAAEQEATAAAQQATAEADRRVQAAEQATHAMEATLEKERAQCRLTHARNVELCEQLRLACKREGRSKQSFEDTYDRLSLDAQHELQVLFKYVPPPSQNHLNALLRDQAHCRAAFQRTGKATCVWSKEVREWAVGIFLVKPSAYEAASYANVMTLPSLDAVKRWAAVNKSSSGHDSRLYQSVRAAAARLPPPQREVALIFDEVLSTPFPPSHPLASIRFSD